MKNSGITVLILVSFGYLAILVFAIGPIGGFWCGDQGAKLIQIHSVVERGFVSAKIVYPAEGIDNDRRFSPARGQFVQLPKGTYSMFPAAFAFVEAPFLATFGMAGLHVPPILATLVIIWAAGKLSSRFLDTGGVVALQFVLAFGSPLLFYSLTVWEHTLATAFVMLGLLATWVGIERKSVFLGITAGVFLSIAVLFRNETVLALPAIVIATLISSKDPRLSRRVLFQIGAGATPLLVALLAFNQIVFGNPLGPHVSLALNSVWTPAGLDIALHIQQRISWIAMLLIPDRPVWLFLLAATLIIVSALSGRVSGSIRNALLVVVMSGLVILGFGVLLNSGAGLQRTLLMTFPIWTLAVLAGGSANLPPERVSGHDGGFRQFQAGSFLFWFAVLFTIGAVAMRLPHGGVQWGPRLLLPVVPALAIAAAAVVRELFSMGTAKGLPALRWGTVAAALVLSAAGLYSQYLGLGFLRQSKSQSRFMATTVAAPKANVVISSSGLGTALVASLIVDSRLIFTAETQQKREELLSILIGLQKTGFTFLDRNSDAFVSQEFMDRSGLIRTTDARSLPWSFHVTTWAVKDMGASSE